MSKLLRLKEWLTVSDAARRLTISFGEDVTEADVLRLALDRHLKLSVYFVNHANAKRGKLVPIQDAVYQEVPALLGGRTIRLYEGPALQIKGEKTHIIELENSVVTLDGVYDLAMFGEEIHDVENRFQMLTGGPEVTLVTMDGAFVVDRLGFIYQIQRAGNAPNPETLKALHESWLERCPQDKTPMPEMDVRSIPKIWYYPSVLPEDSVLVVRTEALREFEKHCLDEPMTISRAHVSDKLATLQQAALRWWGNATPDDKTTYSKNSDVIAWLMERGYSNSLAASAASIIRPDWAETGRPPEK